MPHDPLAWIEDELHGWEAEGLLRRLAVRESGQGSRVQLAGVELLNFTSNDYLGLADEPLRQAALEAVERFGWGSGASPLVTGRGSLHAELERGLAEFEGTEAALLFSSGYAANVAAIATLAGKPDIIFSDAKNHASIIDGCRLSGARIQIYQHGCPQHLADLMRTAPPARRRLIVTDGLFSMDGDLAPLPQLAELADELGALLLVDEAHATGVLGAQGRGAAELLGVEDRIPVRVGTLSKALGSAGGFVVGSARLIQWLANRARPYVFSTAAPQALAATALAALQLVRDEPWRRQELLRASEQVRRRLRGQGWNVGTSASQIIPLVIGRPQLAMGYSSWLRRRGILVPGIRPPSVPQGESRLRISLSYAHTAPMREHLVQALGQLAAEVKRSPDEGD